MSRLPKKVSLKDYSSSVLHRKINDMNIDEFYNFVGKLDPINQVDYTTYPQSFKNLQIILNKMQEPNMRGKEYNCIGLSKVQFKQLNCYNPEILKRGSFKKIGAESENGIVFLVSIGKFKMVLKTAVLYTADPLDYEYHIQNILNPIREYVPNYSLGYFYFNCNVSDGLKIKEIIMNESISAIEGSFNSKFKKENDSDSDDSYDSDDSSDISMSEDFEEEDEELEDYRDLSIKPISRNIFKNRDTLTKYMITELRKLGDSKRKHGTLYNRLLNTFPLLDIGTLCVDAPKPKESKRMSTRLNEIYQEKATIKMGTPNLFIATELTNVTEALGDFVEKIGQNGRTETQLISILIQTLCALQAGGDRYKFTHYDLHAGNVLLTKLDKPAVYLYYFGNNSKMPFVPIYTNYLVTLIDFGRSYVDGKRMYFDIEEDDGREKEYMFSGDEEANITTNKFNSCFDMVRLLYFIAAEDALQDKKYKKFLKLFKILNREFKLQMNEDRDSLLYPHNSGPNIKTPLGFIHRIYKEPGLVDKIKLASDIYLFNANSNNGKMKTSLDVLESLDTKAKSDYNWNQDKKNSVFASFAKGGKKKSKRSKSKKKRQRGGNVNISNDEIKEILSTMKRLKKRKQKKSNNHINYGKNVYNKVMRSNFNGFGEEKIIKAGKRKLKRKLKGGSYNLNHDARQSLDRIQN